MTSTDSWFTWFLYAETIAGDVLFLGLMITGGLISRSRIHAGTKCFLAGCVLLGIRAAYQILSMVFWTREFRPNVLGTNTFIEALAAVGQIMPILNAIGFALLIVGIFRAFRWPDESGAVINEPTSDARHGTTGSGSL